MKAYRVQIEGQVMGGGTFIVVSRDETLAGEADTAKEALELADKLMRGFVATLQPGIGTVARIERIKDGDVSQVCLLDGVSPGAGPRWDAMIIADECSRYVLGGKRGKLKAKSSVLAYALA